MQQNSAPVRRCDVVTLWSGIFCGEAPLSQLGKNRAGRDGIEKFWMALRIREKIWKVTE
jgi:hypothetical protein